MKAEKDKFKCYGIWAFDLLQAIHKFYGRLPIKGVAV